ncbi:MAG: uroporphyrinogen decarboxylase family protein [Kiritimatiellota bacterium]|nr:uroporphyrinogen decarboxylase family protein [Kiritimatiellota bacterium]
MNARERFLATAGFRPVDRTFLLAPWMWNSTITRWRNEGLPADVNLVEYFHTDQEQGAPVGLQGKYGPHLWPQLERLVLSESEEFQIVRDEEGNTVKLFKNDPSQSMPEWIEYPMKNRDDWEQIIKPRLDPKIPGRCPQGADLQRYADQVRNRDYPLGPWCGSFYGHPRSYMGVERISLMFYDDPALIHEMCDHLAELAVQTLTPILTAVPFDFAFIWEDMAGKGGPLCSPATYREFCLEPLKRVTSLLNKYGVRHIIVDSDGNNDVLIPLWLEAGVTGLRPFEVAAGCDAVATRRKYGRSLIIQGAIDKRALAKGREAIDREVLSKVPWLCMQGGYFPQVDHLVPPDVSLENYSYYAQLLRRVVEDPERVLHEAIEKGLWQA